MATPLGHALAGASVGLGFASEPGQRRRAVVLATCAAILPDLDFIPGLLVGDPARFHHLWTHTVAAGVLVALLVWWLSPGRNVRLAGIVLVAYLSHLVLDWLTADPTPPHGLPILWPASDQYLISPVPLLPRVIHSSANPANLHNLQLAVREVLFFGSLALALVLYRRNWAACKE